eukprot:3961477-Amphidinium_carterae.1
MLPQHHAKTSIGKNSTGPNAEMAKSSVPCIPLECVLPSLLDRSALECGPGTMTLRCRPCWQTQRVTGHAPEERQPFSRVVQTLRVITFCGQKGGFVQALHLLSCLERSLGCRGNGVAKTHF